VGMVVSVYLRSPQMIWKNVQLENTVIVLYSGNCRLDSVGGEKILTGQERIFSKPGIGTAFLFRELSMEGVFWFCVRECPKVI